MLKALKPYADLIPFIATAMGENVEVALHDLTVEGGPIIAIANNGISGRDVGATLTQLGTHLLEEKQYEKKDFVVNYKTLTEKGKIVRTSNYFIKDENNQLIGMMCINVNTSDYEYLNNTIKRILGIKDDQDDVEYKMDNPIQVLSYSIETAVQESIKVALQEMGYPDYMVQSRLTADEKMKVVKKLHEKGIFNVKGSIPCVAKELNSSEPTIYRYLKKI